MFTILILPFMFFFNSHVVVRLLIASSLKFSISGGIKLVVIIFGVPAGITEHLYLACNCLSKSLSTKCICASRGK